MAYFIIGGIGLVVAGALVACLYEWWMGDDGYEDVRVVREADPMVAEDEAQRALAPLPENPQDVLAVGQRRDDEVRLDEEWADMLQRERGAIMAEELERRPGEWTQEWTLGQMAVYADVQAFMSAQDADAARYIAGVEAWRRDLAVAA